MKIQIAENIKRYRTERGFTQSDLAVLLSVSTQAVSKWENGQAFPDISILPMLSKYLEVSIDELMGNEEQQKSGLKRELHERRCAVIDDYSERLVNELRILEIFEELARTEPFYLIGYFQRIMSIKGDEKLYIKDLEDRIAGVRQMIRDRLSSSGMSERMKLLSTVAAYEDEDKLGLWSDEYELPDYIHTSIWDELLLSRYVRKKNIDKLTVQNQKILYGQIKSTVHYLTYSVSDDVKEQSAAFRNPKRYKSALDLINLYSTRIDDIFIFTRILTEVRYAEVLLMNGYAEESLDMFSYASEHLSMLYRLPDGCVLRGSVSVFDAIDIVVDFKEKYEKCIINIGGYERNPLYDKIRDDKRFAEFLESIKIFFPIRNCKSWVNEKGSDSLDAKWEMLLSRARMEANALSDGNTVVMLTSGGAVYSISFQNTDTAIDAEGAMKFLIEKKKNGDARIERIVCMWHDGSIDLPSFSFREALLTVDSRNLSAQMLLNGFYGYTVKTVKVTVPKGYY